MTIMTQSIVKAALDRAFDEHIGKIFSVLVQNVIANDHEALDHFANGVEAGLAAHADASALIDKLVKA
ncbi:hypothetical protein [Bradyrhizobium sp. Tv2a-2]|uniref:hypothetical protein n=1 Tax=Bradyrhizobium sp. Tv2a-2 TaxID=113395 RepID=UPI0012EB3C54|nr:hypothetical protein [Bradyrhizobium sp. Tv2a-2]